MRKPVQVAISDDMNFEAITDCVVLCDDGSMWITNYSHIKNKSAEWTRLPDIPQQDEPKSKPVTSPDVVAALRELAKAEGDYRNRYTSADYSGRITFLMFDKMRRAGDAAREVLKRIDGQEEPR